jgi:hypothetical protein
MKSQAIAPILQLGELSVNLRAVEVYPEPATIVYTIVYVTTHYIPALAYSLYKHSQVLIDICKPLTYLFVQQLLLGIRRHLGLLVLYSSKGILLR